MLSSLRVKDFLLIREAHLDFAPGLNVLTGETGTGKSMLLRALALLFGRRADPGWIRRGAAALRVEAAFRAPPRARRLAQALGLQVEEGEILIVREVRREGPGRAFVNGQRVLVETLRRLGDELVEIHGQREEERFRRGDAQRELLDVFGNHAALRREVRQCHRELEGAQGRLGEHGERIERLARDEEWLRYQVEEIERVAPRAGEIETLRGQVSELREAAREAEFIALAEDLLAGRGGAVLAAMEELDHRMAGLAAGGERWETLRAEVREGLTHVRAVARGLRELRRDVAGGLRELPVLEERLGALDQLQRKHRRGLDEVIELLGQMQAGLEELARGRETEQRLREACGLARAKLEQQAGSLSAARQKAARELTAAMSSELDELGMPGCRLRVSLEPMGDSQEGALVIGPTGSERVTFEVETNAGEGFRPLGRIASGGEMARLALALRVVLGKRGHALLAVFDEVDAGLGGAAAQSVAARLARVAKHQQVLLVTHLPVIAAAAERQFAIEKQPRAGVFDVGVRPIEGDERIAEIARMLAGNGRDPEARRHATALLERAFRLPARDESGRS
ncbi:MAG: DNA repair protein RecN [Candidatus Eisenbacteria bacterium]